MAKDLLSDIRAEIDARMGELRPALQEYEGLLAAADALGVSVPTGGARAGAAKRAGSRARAGSGGTGARRGRPPGGRPAGSGKARRGPRAGSPRAPRGAAGKAILAALEHGSHTVRELVVVTAMADPNIRANLRRMLAEGTVAKVSRDGKSAYALPSAA
ncbi:MAG TPA: hypothetical protein VL972_06020 [Solirubrobacteraceae bacterium]|nr:hypothetical protein [Solirubrobacteraceae bacterium]